MTFFPMVGSLLQCDKSLLFGEAVVGAISNNTMCGHSEGITHKWVKYVCWFQVRGIGGGASQVVIAEEISTKAYMFYPNSACAAIAG